MDRRSFLSHSALLGGALGLPRLAFAAKYPERPINYIVPVAPGGGSDFVGRTVTEVWGRELGASFIVNNQAGASGVIACEQTTRAKPDGYTLMQGYVATLSTNPATRKVPYDPIRDFTAIGMIGATPSALTIDAKLPVNSLKEFIAYAQAHNGSLNYASTGAGTLTHLLMELLKQRASFKMEHIAYKGGGPAFTDLLGGRVQCIFAGLTAVAPHIRAKTMRALAVTGDHRHPNYPDLPTFKELGLPGFEEAQQWYGVSGPANLPAEIVGTLNQSLNKALAIPDLSKRLDGEAMQTMPMTPEQFADFIKRDYDRWAKLAKTQNIWLET